MSSEQLYFTQPGYVIAAAMFLSGLGIVAVILRFWARRRQKQALKTDDWLMLPAVVLVTGISIAVTYGVCQGAIAHRTRIPAGLAGSPLGIATPQVALVYEIQWAFDMMLPLALGSIKASFLFFSRRIFVVDRKSKANYILSGLVVLVALWSISFFFASAFQCKMDFWDFWVSETEREINFTENMHIALSVCITGFITDVAVIGGPIPLIWQLNLSTERKISITAVFLLGSVTIAASLLRLIMMVRLFILGFSPEDDRILVVTEYLYWGIVEGGVGVVAACLPTLQSLVQLCSWEPILRTAKGLFNSRGPNLEYIISRDIEHNNGRLEVAQLTEQEANNRIAYSTEPGRATKSDQVWLENKRATNTAQQI